MKVLNLDKLIPNEGRELVIGDKSYPVIGISVANFIETSRIAEKMTADTPIADQIEATIDMIMRSIPSISRELLTQLSLEQLQTIVAFIRGDAIAGVEQHEAGNAAAQPATNEDDAEKK